MGLMRLTFDVTGDKDAMERAARFALARLRGEGAEVSKAEAVYHPGEVDEAPAVNLLEP